jgi:trk system potassium uptake protein TrkH
LRPRAQRRKDSFVAKQATELRYAVRFRVVFKVFRSTVPRARRAVAGAVGAMSVIFGDTPISLRYGIVIGGLAALGAGLARLRAPSRVQANEGMVLVALMFLFTPLVMSYPMMGSGLGFLDALFEAISGVTTTGLSTKATLVGAPQTFLLPAPGCSGTEDWASSYSHWRLLCNRVWWRKGLAVTEAETDDLVGGTRAYAQRALKVYGVLTALGIIGSLAVGVGFFDAVLYTFAAVSTGGFAPHDGSLADVRLARTGVDYAALPRRCDPAGVLLPNVKEKRHVAVDFLQLKAVVIVCLVVSLAVGAAMRLSAGMAWPQVLHHAPLLAFSAQTTAGFSSMPCAQLDAGSKLVLIFSMLVGGRRRIDCGRIQTVAAVDRGERVSVNPPADLFAKACRHRTPAGRPPVAGRRDPCGPYCSSCCS